MNKPLSIAELAAIAAQTEDQTETIAVTFDDTPPEAGVTIGRFIEYIELGKQPQPDYQGKPKPPADVVRVTFELLHPKKNIKEFEHEGEKRVRGDTVAIQLTKKLSDKAKFKKLFNTMTYGRDSIKHMAQMLGEAFIITIYHNVVEKDGTKRTYVNLDKDGVYGISAPFVTDPLEDTKTAVPVREPIKPLRLFLFENPTKETWDSLFIDGTREVKKDGGETVQVSKNWLQEKIMSSTNFKGSSLDAMLGGVADLPTSEEEVGVETEVVTEAVTAKINETKAAAKAAKAKDAKPAAAAAKPAAKKEGAADDALAALGLV